MKVNNLNLSIYEKKALEEIYNWKNPINTWDNLIKYVNLPFEMAGKAIMKIPGAKFIIENSVLKLVSILTDFSQWSVRANVIFEEYRKNGFNINQYEDIFDLDLEHIDKTIGLLGSKYKTIAAGEGVGAGSIGIAGIPVDIVALITINLRAIAEYAIYYGFDIAIKEERFYAMNILSLSSSPTDSAKQIAITQLSNIAKDLAQKRSLTELENIAFVKVVEEIASSLGAQLTEAKLAQVIPATGALIAGGFNAYYTSRTCEAANMLYRERWFFEKYGEDFISSIL
ncbi:MAG: EcsC family protein [Desulfobacterales bacterium]|nr:EcsC family protein [Desulfobacterales bacterium]MBF0396501.1 EcsC family protein [Desulfobacterales bacterium]